MCTIYHDYLTYFGISSYFGKVELVVLPYNIGEAFCPFSASPFSKHILPVRSTPDTEVQMGSLVFVLAVSWSVPFKLLKLLETDRLWW